MPILAVAAVALLSGVLPGVVAGAVSTLGCSILFYEPFSTLRVRDPFEVVRLAGLGIISTVVAAATGSIRNAYRRAAEERRAALRLAEQLRREKERAERATTLRDDVLAVVSHDLKNPIALIAVTADLLDRRCTTRGLADLAEKARAIRRATTQAERLILDLLDVASIEAGRFSIRAGSHPPHDVAEEALELLRGTSDPRAAALALDVEPGLPQVQCDRGRIIQVLSNLLVNAARATPASGNITVRVAGRDQDVLFAVSDTGRGISPQDLPHIFDRFRRGESVDYAGSGLGLAIAKGIVEAHNGRIWAESQPGQGARFFFTLPAMSNRTAGSPT